MLDKAMIEMMAQGIWDTCYMTLVSTFFGYVIGLPLGIALTLTDENGITPNRAVYRILEIIINVTRSRHGAGLLGHGGRHRRRRTGRYRHPLRLLSLRHRRHAGDAGVHRRHCAAAAGHGQPGGAEDRSQKVTGKKFRIRRKPEGAYGF